MKSRIARHMSKRKTLHWHIDYLLERGRILGAKRYREEKSECRLNRRVEKLPGSRVIAPGFGSSDCECRTHLFHFERNPARELH
jgi:sugar fermentation stimulation protein A